MIIDPTRRDSTVIISVTDDDVLALSGPSVLTLLAIEGRVVTLDIQCDMIEIMERQSDPFAVRTLTNRIAKYYE